MSFDEQFRRNLDKVLGTQEGIDVFREIMQDLGANQLSIVVDSKTAEINTRSTIFNEAKRGVWLDLRSYISREKLIQIEYPPEKTNKEHQQWQTEKQEQPEHRTAQRQLPAQEQELMRHRTTQRNKPEPPTPEQ